MFFKQYNYKPRSNSQSSTGSSGQIAGSPPKDTSASTAAVTTNTTGGTGPVSAAAAARRRSSAAGSEKFAGLHSVKRTSQDAAVSERKASWAEQKPGGGGVISGMWNSFTKGG